jgi:hypothetical protein
MRHIFLKGLGFGALTISLISAAGCASTPSPSTLVPPSNQLASSAGNKSAGEVNREADDERNFMHLSGWRKGVQVPANYPASQ